jgi:hypothetical protein
MSASTAIGMVGESLRALLEAEMSVMPAAPVTLLAPDESGASRRINLFLYKIQENPFFKNSEWMVSRSDPTRITPPPLSLNLYYLLTPYAQNDAETGNTSAHEILGEAMRVMHQNPIFPTLHLVPGLVDAHEQIKIIHMPLDMDELSKVWSTFSTPFRLSVAYEVSVVQLDQSTDNVRDMPMRIQSVGVPNISAARSVPSLQSISPLAGPPGTVVTVQGKNLAGWIAYLDIGTQRQVDGLELNADSFTFVVPVGLAAGFQRVRADISKLHRSTYYFEVTV